MKQKVAFCTLGCKVNQYESEAVLEQFLACGYDEVDFSEKADVYVINTCTVTHLSDRKSRQMIRRVKQLNKEAVLVAMGCYVQTNQQAVLDIPEVDILIGTAERKDVPGVVAQFIEQQERINLVNAQTDTCFESLHIDGTGQAHTRAYLKVQDGCNQFCSYCIIPYARGRIRSRSIEDSVTEAQRLVKAGFSELVVTGIHLASWGKDNESGSLLDLLKALQKVDGLKRIRLGSLEPTLITQAFAEEIAGMDKMCHHFHLSLQSGCDATLKRMNRKYSAKDYMQSVLFLRAVMPDVAVTTDIMVGFPGESEAEFAESYAFMKALHLADAHVFKYSPRTGTVAAKMTGQIAPHIKEERSQKLIELTKQYQIAFAQKYLNQTMDVLFEQEVKPGIFEGKTGNYIAVQAASDADISGRILPVKICKVCASALLGELV